MNAAKPGVIRIRNWEKFQHYKHRNPPWLRIYVELLDNPEFLRMPEVTRWHLIGLWLLAGRMHNRIPADRSFVEARLGAQQTIDFALLEAGQWITLEGDASALLANGRAPASNLRQDPQQRGAPEQSRGRAEAEQSSGTTYPADAEQTKHTEGQGGVPRETPAPTVYATIFPLIRAHLWRPDGKCPAEINGKPWSEDQEGTVIRELAKSYSVSDLEVTVLGLGNMLRGLAEAERPDWLEVGSKASLRAVYKSRSGVVQMVEHCRRAYWSVENKRPKKSRAGEPTAVGELLPGVLP